MNLRPKTLYSRTMFPSKYLYSTWASLQYRAYSTVSIAPEPIVSRKEVSPLTQSGPLGLQPGLIAHWKLDQDALDSSGNDHHGSFIGKVKFGQGKVGSHGI